MTSALIDPSVAVWQKARKVKPIRAKLLRDVLRADDATMKFLLQTLEGIQSLQDGDDTMVCIGIDFDVWQQKKGKLFAKYNITDIDKNGWLQCTPKPDVEVDCFEVLRSEPFVLKALWGTKMEDGTYLQTGQPGDFICRSPADQSDVWIVARKIFKNTYEIVV